jgi:hypothetical protein
MPHLGMITFEHTLNASERISEYIGLTDDGGRRYGSQIAKEDAIVTVIDGQGRRFQMRRLHGNQLSKCTRWSRTNAITGPEDTKIIVRFDSRESDEEGNPVLHLFPASQTEHASDSELPCVFFLREGKRYEIRAAFDGLSLSVRAFLAGKPANGFTYCVDLPVAVEFRLLIGSSAYEALVESARRDIVDGSWERIQTSFKRGADAA